MTEKLEDVVQLLKNKSSQNPSKFGREKRKNQGCDFIRKVRELK